MGSKMKKNMPHLLLLVFVALFAVSCGGGGNLMTSYLYSSKPLREIALKFGTDYTNIDNWGSGAIFDNNYQGDAQYSPVFSVDNTTAPNWGGFGALAFTGFAAGFTAPYETLNFKFKADEDMAVNVKFPFATAYEEIIYNASEARNLGNGWYEFTIRLANHGDTSATTEFALLASGDFYVTDIYFSNMIEAEPASGDHDGDGRYYIKSGDGNREIDLVYGVDYGGITIWESGTVISDAVDATYGDIWTMTPGGGWGVVLAFYGFEQGYASSFGSLNFKMNTSGVYNDITINLPNAGTAEVTYDLASYGTDLGDNWFAVSIPLAGHGDLSLPVDLAILQAGGTAAFSVTDLYFE
jgi:hypothetical protein